MTRESLKASSAAKCALLGFFTFVSIVSMSGCQQATPRVKTPATTKASSHLYSAPNSPYAKQRPSSKAKVYQPHPQVAPSKPTDVTNDDRHPSRWNRKLKARYA